MRPSGLLPDDAFRFVARAGLALLALAALWLLVREPWGVAFRAFARALVWMAGADGRVTVAPAPLTAARTPSWDVLLTLLDGTGAPRMRLTMSSLRSSYVPLGVWASLTFASWRKLLARPKPLVTVTVGFTGVLLFCILSRLVSVLRHMALIPDLRPFPEGSAASGVVDLIYLALVNPPGFEYVGPAFIWLVSFVVPLSSPPWRWATEPTPASARLGPP